MQDAGKTRADEKAAYFCLHFARGKCMLGADCTFLHRIPKYEDEARFQKDQGRDCFGRDRFLLDRDDMNGSGAFSRENTTLFVSGFHIALDTEAIIRDHFSEWGPIQSIKVILERAIAFVRYHIRASAEFAKEAMQEQGLDGDEVLSIRWANEDPNPAVQFRERQTTHEKMEEAMQKKLRQLAPHDHAAIYFQLTGEYPNTDDQYNSKQPQLSQQSNPDPFYGWTGDTSGVNDTSSGAPETSSVPTNALNLLADYEDEEEENDEHKCTNTAEDNEESIEK